VFEFCLLSISKLGQLLIERLFFLLLLLFFDFALIWVLLCPELQLFIIKHFLWLLVIVVIEVGDIRALSCQQMLTQLKSRILRLFNLGPSKGKTVIGDVLVFVVDG
jgi:hypothetical protein